MEGINLNKKFRFLSGFIAMQLCLAPVLGAAEKGEIAVPEVNQATISETINLINSQSNSPRQMEDLDRGLVAVQVDQTVFISWRWLGTESSSVTYNIYRNGSQINNEPISLTNFTDICSEEGSTYQVAAVIDGKEQEKCEAVKVLESNALTISLDKPADGEIEGESYTYSANDASVADLDGDGEYEIILKWDPSNSKDASAKGYTGPTYIDAYKLNGEKLWRINLGPNIRSGAHDTHFMAYDFDGDGKAEVAFKTADGTVDGMGKVIGDANANYAALNEGKNLQGPLYLSIFNGETGAVMDTVDYDPQSTDEGGIEAYGDDWGNRSERYLATIGYTDGKTPSMIFARGYYTSKTDAKVGRTVMASYIFKDGKLKKQWRFDTNDYDNNYIGQGNHSMSTADIDFDGKDEVIYGALVVDDDGAPLYSTGLGHGDAQHTGDLIPSRPGLETFSVHETTTVDYSIDMRDARTGELIFGSYEAKDVGRGMSADIDPRYEGAESWANGKMMSSTGEVIATNPSISTNFRVYWDGDLGEELLDNIHVSKWDTTRNRAVNIFSAEGCTSINGTKANPSLAADIFGDWREEIVYPILDSTALKIFTTTTPTNYRMYTLMHDSQYRNDIATQNTGYNQPAHTSFYLGYDTTEIKVPNIIVSDRVNPDLEKETWKISDLYTGQFTYLSINSSNAVVNQTLCRIENEDDAKQVKPFVGEDGNYYVPKAFIEKYFNVNMSVASNQGLTNVEVDKKLYTAIQKEEIVYVPANLILEERGYTVTLDLQQGFMGVSDIAKELSYREIKNILGTLEKSNTPSKFVLQPIVPVAKYSENQLPIYNVTASGDDGNIETGAVDGDMNTRWSAKGANYLVLDLNEEKEVGGVAIAMWKGNERIYPFSIEVSTDGENWTTALAKTQNTGDSDQAEEYFFNKKFKARYVRYSGDGDTLEGKNYCHISEIAVLP